MVHPYYLCRIISYYQMGSLIMVLFAFVLSLIFLNVACKWWILPHLLHTRLKAIGFSGPKPSFPLGNLPEMGKKITNTTTASFPKHPNDIHSIVLPHFSRWQKLYGKVFVYWVGTAPFVYVAEPEFLKKMTAGIKGKEWGKAVIFKHYARPLFGRKALVTSDGEDWARRRHFVSSAFAPSYLKAAARLMAEATRAMVDEWQMRIDSEKGEINVEEEMIGVVGKVVAEIMCSMNEEEGKSVLGKIRALQRVMFAPPRKMGVPYGKLLSLDHTLKANRLGKEIDDLLYPVVNRRVKEGRGKRGDVVEVLMESAVEEGSGKLLWKAFTMQEMVDDIKALFFGGYDTTAMAVGWSLVMLAVHTKWQMQIREEVREVIGDGRIGDDLSVLLKLRKMGWVMNEVLRLYVAVPNVQRQAKRDIRVDNLVIPKGTNIWIDNVSMHHDRELWGEDVHEFKPERFKNDIYGGCRHKMGYLPFGFGGRMCVGKNLFNIEYRVVLALILSNFTFSLSPNYRHSPKIMLFLTPRHGMPIIFQKL